MTLIPEAYQDKDSALIIYTPAIPASHQELVYFKEHQFNLQKRAQFLGTLTRTHKGLCVAGTHRQDNHHINGCTHSAQQQSRLQCLLGGITKNYGTNYILSATSDYVVIEADEFDRSFHWLTPYASVITATDPDHLDIYGTKEAYLESFAKYSSLIQPGGYLILHPNLEMEARVQR